MYVFDEFFLGGSWSVPLVHRDDAEVKFYFLERERRKKRKTVRNSRDLRFISANLKINSRRRKGRKKRNLVLREKYKRAAAGGRTDGRTDFPGTAAEKKAVRERLYRRENTQQLESNNKTLKNISLSLSPLEKKKIKGKINIINKKTKKRKKKKKEKEKRNAPNIFGLA
jgi:hypothetical protein